MQEWSLDRKIQVTQTRIMEWYERWGGKAYISFSGGKDSTILLDLARRIYPSIPAVFVDTGLEYPEVREFALSKDNVIRLKPDIPFNAVIEKYGYPVVSKEQSAFIQEYRTTKSEKLKDIRWNGNKYGQGKISKKWRILVDAPFPVSDKCCDVMKKNPCKRYEKETGNYPIIATMATESFQRKSNWLQYGCNAFDKQRPTSQPMSFWTEQDIIQYIIRFNIDFAEIYGDAIYDGEKYFLTGEQRTGCMFCMFGIQCDTTPNKFQRMRVTHPKQYDYCINKLGCGKVLDYIGVKYGMKIYYAHHIWKYDTKIEEYELSIIKNAFPGGEIINPNTSIDQFNPEEKIMFDCFATIKDCDALVFSDLSGVTGKGVISEIEYAKNLGLGVYRIVANRLEEITDKVRYNLLDTGSNRIFAEIL